MRLRTKLFQFGLGTVIPPLLLAVVLGILLIRYEQEAFRRGAFDRNRAFMTAVDTEIRGHMAALRVLAASKSLEADDLPVFHEQALRVLKSQGDWQSITLTLPSGGQVINTNLPFGAPLPATVEPDSVTQVVLTAAPAVGPVAYRSLSRKYGSPVRIPVMRDGSVRYVLSAVIELDAFARLIEQQRLPPTWISGLVDSTGHFIARVPRRSPAEMASDVYRQAVAGAPEGWYRGSTVEGRDSFTAHRSSALSHWSVGLAIPANEVNAAAYRAAWFVLLGALLTVALTLSFAYWMGRRISAPISRLAAAARSIGRDTESAKAVANAEIREVREVAQALNESAIAIRERQVLIEREQSILRAADRAKDEFLAMLGHELRNPLSAVSNAAALLTRPDLPAENRTAVHSIISRQTEQLTRLVNDLLDVGRVVAGKIHLERETVDLHDVAHAAASAILATRRADAHRISIGDSAPVFVRGDRTRLEQVVTNLLVNAITYTPPGGSIEISVGTRDGEAVLAVTDTGAGLTEEDRDAVFALFYQVDRGLHRKGGLGIGLTLVRRLVEMQGGSVAASSPGLGRGSTFTVRLPLQDTAAAADPQPAPAGERPAPLEILVIDDSEDARNSLKMLLEAGGHTVHTANDGLSGLRAALSLNPRVALVDIGMPGMDGYELAREIRRRHGGGLALIAMTGYGLPDDIRRAMDAGFDAHLVKPANPAALDALLARLTRRPAPVAVP